ncbi:MAG: glycosyltransferase family 2 protein [Aureliella sp.]
MPRLSIIVPHRHQDSRLEATLLSLLENRPFDSEIIVVHDGTYGDPYQLGDEVIFIEEERSSNTLKLLNAGVMAACSPAVCVLLDGAIVTDGWGEAALSTLLETETAAVAVAVTTPRGQTSHGIDARLLNNTSFAQAGRVEASSARTECIGPVLACGFYRRKVLLALGGWNEELEEHAADVELALALDALGLACQCDVSTRIAIHAAQSRKLSSAAWKQLASLVTAHGLVAPSWGNSLKSLIGGCLQGRLFTAAAWASGLRDAITIRRTQLRMNHARQQFPGDSSQQSLRIYQNKSAAAGPRRRAA